MLEAMSALALDLPARAAAAVRRFRDVRSDPVSEQWDYLFVRGLAGLDAEVDAVAAALTADSAPTGRPTQ